MTPLLTYGPIEGVTAAVIVDIRREKEEGYYPCKYRVTYMRKQVYYPCMDLTLKQFSDMHGQVRNANSVRTKKLIQAGLDRITDAIEEIISKEPFTLERLAKRLSRGTVDSVMSEFENTISELTTNGKIGSSVWYSCAKTSIEKFAKKDLKFADITPEWLKKYETHLLKEEKAYTTISIYMRALRAIINKGLRDGIISQAQYPFVVKKNGKYQIPEGTGRKFALSTAQLLDVFNYQILPDDEKWRDLWVFSFYCNGANIGDILRFKYGDIEGNYITWHRKKTITTDPEKYKIRAIITDEMRSIIEKYGNPGQRASDYIFPYLTNGLTPVAERMIIQNVIHLINKKMKKIGRALGYGDITTYWARHTWASISRREGVSLFSISKGMGHKNLATTQVYLDSLSDDELIENAAKLPRRN